MYWVSGTIGTPFTLPTYGNKTLLQNHLHLQRRACWQQMDPADLAKLPDAVKRRIILMLPVEGDSATHSSSDQHPDASRTNVHSVVSDSRGALGQAEHEDPCSVTKLQGSLKQRPLACLPDLAQHAGMAVVDGFLDPDDVEVGVCMSWYNMHQA